MYNNVIQLYNNIAVIEFKKGKIYSSINKIKKAMRYTRKEKILQYNLANANYKICNYDIAKNNYLKLLEDANVSNELKSEIYYNLGNIECMYENYSEGLENYYMALLLNSKDSDAKFNIELVEHMSKPIIYNDKVLLFPKQKIEEQIKIIDERNEMERELYGDILNDVEKNQNEYSNVSESVRVKQKYILEILEIEQRKLLDNQKLFNKNIDEQQKGFKAKTENKNIDKEINNAEKINKDTNKLFSDMDVISAYFSECKQEILGANGFNEEISAQKRKLNAIINSYKNKINFSDMSGFIDKSAENINLLTRELLQKINQAEYDVFTEKHAKIDSGINMILDYIVNISGNLSPNDKKYLTHKINSMISSVGNIYIKGQIENYKSMREILRQIKAMEDKLRILVNENINLYDADDKIIQAGIDYDKYVALRNKINQYRYNIYNLYLLYDNLIEQNRNNVINIENFKYIMKSKLSFKICDINIVYGILDNIIQNPSAYTSALREQKQVCKEIETNYKNQVNLIQKLLSDVFYLYNLRLNMNDPSNDNAYLIRLLPLLQDKEDNIKNKKIEKDMIENDIKLIQKKIYNSKDGRPGNEYLEKEKNLRQDALKRIELDLLRDTKEFINIFLKNVNDETYKIKTGIVKIDALFQEVVEIGEAEQESVKLGFSLEKTDLSSEIINLEKEKKYVAQKDIRENLLADVEAQNLVGKSLYQREKLNILLGNEKKISLQLNKFKQLRKELMKLEKTEFNALEDDLADKQLSLVKYYLSIEDDNLKKSLIRETMQSLYKIKYNAELEAKTDFEEINLFDTFAARARKDMFRVYKSYMYQLRQLNNFTYRMKIINTILELEYILKLKSRIEFYQNHKYIGTTDKMEKDLNISIKTNMKNKIIELANISDISKEYINLADNIRREIIRCRDKQKRLEKNIYDEEKESSERKLYLLDEKINVLEHILNINDKRFGKDIKKEIGMINKEKSSLKTDKENSGEQFSKDLYSDENMKHVIRASNLMISNIKESEKELPENASESAAEKENDVADISYNGRSQKDNKNSLMKSDIDRILSSYSNTEKVVTEKNKKTKKEETKNDW